jgi:hypothetical protein
MGTAAIARPIRNVPTRFLVNGTRKRRGFVLLYPDKLGIVRSPAEIVSAILLTVFLIFVVYPVGNVLGGGSGVIGVLVGGAIGRAVGRWMAVRAVDAGSHWVSVIPLDTVTSLRTEWSEGFAGWSSTETLVVTTADGTEYGFRGQAGHLQDSVASVLSALGREVRPTPLGLEVTARAG